MLKLILFVAFHKNDSEILISSFESFFSLWFNWSKNCRHGPYPTHLHYPLTPCYGQMPLYKTKTISGWARNLFLIYFLQKLIEAVINAPASFWTDDLKKSLCEKCLYSKFFWSVFSRIRTRKIPNTDNFYTVNIFVDTAQKMKFSIKDLSRKLRIWSHLLKISLMENFIFCTVWVFEKSYIMNFYRLCLIN